MDIHNDYLSLLPLELVHRSDPCPSGNAISDRPVGGRSRMKLSMSRVWITLQVAKKADADTNAQKEPA